MRRIVEVIDFPDLAGLAGLLILAIAAGLFDPRFSLVVIGSALLVIAMAYARPQQPPAPPPAPPAE